MTLIEQVSKKVDHAKAEKLAAKVKKGSPASYKRQVSWSSLLPASTCACEPGWNLIRNLMVWKTIKNGVKTMF